MTVYDFKELSSLDFEELVRDLLQAHWKCQLESFGPGKDRGIDIRRIDGPKRIIIQAKHWRKSGGAPLVREMKREREKALKLAPSRYLLATSVSMTQDLKQKIIDAMEGVPLAPEDILGQEDINNLLQHYPAIEQRHFKLWLSSTTVLERILHSGVYNRTAAEMDLIRKMVPRFVQSQSVGDAEQLLEQTGALVIAGAPGVGKTTLARMLLWRHAEQGWNIFVVDSMEEAMTVASEGVRRLILFDDFLGQIQLSSDHVRGIDARLPPLLSRVASHSNLRFILTTRDYILAQAKTMSARIATETRDAKFYTLNVGSYTRNIRARILFNHMYFSQLSDGDLSSLMADDFYLKVIDHRNFNPRLIDELTRTEYLGMSGRSAQEAFSAALKNPEMLWEHPYRRHMTDDARVILLTLAISGGAISMAAMKNAFQRVAAAMGSPTTPSTVESRYRDAFKEVEGSAVGLLNGHVFFVNPGVRDYVQGVIVSDTLLASLVTAVSLPRELSECISIAKSHGHLNSHARPQAWVSAFERLLSAQNIDLEDHLDISIRLYDDLRSSEMLIHVENAIAALGDAEFDSDDVSKVCAILEMSAFNILPSDISEGFVEYATAAATDLLVNHGRYLSFEDLQSLDSALVKYGKDKAEIITSLKAAMSDFSKYRLDDDLDSVYTIDDLEEFESAFFKLATRIGSTLARPNHFIERRREWLYEHEDRGGGDYSALGSTHDETSSNDEIRSMFGALQI